MPLGLRRPRWDSGCRVWSSLFDDDLSEVLIVLVVDVNDLYSHSDNLLKSVIEPNCVIRVLFGNGQHLERLVYFAPPTDGDHHFIGGKAVV